MSSPVRDGSNIDAGAFARVADAWDRPHAEPLGELSRRLSHDHTAQALRQGQDFCALDNPRAARCTSTPTATWTRTCRAPAQRAWSGAGLTGIKAQPAAGLHAFQLSFVSEFRRRSEGHIE